MTASVTYHKINVACHNEMRDPYYDRYCKRDVCGNAVNCEVCCNRCCSQRITCVVMHAVRIMCVRALQVVTVNYVKNNKKYSLVVNDDSITATGPEGTDNIPITEEKGSVGSSELHFSI